MIQHDELLTTREELEEVRRLLETEGLVGIDTEFIRETTFFPQLEIIQIASKKDSWLVDVPAFYSLDESALDPLKDILTSPKIRKIFHAAVGDQEALYSTLGVLASPIIDTAVAASLCGYGESVGLATLLESALGVRVKKGHARTDWSVRPLPRPLIQYAHSDVIHLVELAEVMMERLEKQGRLQWAFELSKKFEDPKQFESSAEEIAQKLYLGARLDSDCYGPLVELIRWREGRVRQINVPRKRVADDGTLVDLARTQPRDEGHIHSFRGINRGELKSQAQKILAAIQKGKTFDRKLAPEIPRSSRPTLEEGRGIDLLKCFVGLLADRQEVATKHLIRSHDYLQLLRRKPTEVQDLVSGGFMSAQAAQLIGQEIIQFLHGERSLAWTGTSLQVLTRETKR